MAKEILLGHDARTRIKNGIDKAWAAVAPSLGGIGKAAIVEFAGLKPLVADDGLTILRNLSFKDAYEQMGLEIYRSVAMRTSAQGGDGTATTSCLAHAIVEASFNELTEDGSNSREIFERLQAGLLEAIEKLSTLKRDIKDEDIQRIAEVSSLDLDVAKFIASVIKEIGINGVVTVEKGSKIGYSSEVVKGAKFEKGLISQYHINDFKKEQCVLENPYILLADRKISTNEQIKKLMDSIQSTGRKSLLVIADDVDGVALASFNQNSKSVNVIMPNGASVQGTWDIACVRNPYTASRATDFLFDMAALTGGKVISESAGMKLEQADVKDCGQAEKVIVTKDSTLIVGGNYSDALKERITAIERKIEETTSEYEKNMLKERLASLTGGVGVIKVGTYTDEEFNAKKLKFENGINAAQAAMQEGVIAGGGVSLLAVARIHSDVIFQHALAAPFYQQATNAGIREISPKSEKGMNFKTRKEVDMFEAGLIDPFKVTRLALEGAVSVAATLINVETAIVNEPDPIISPYAGMQM